MLVTQRLDLCSPTIELQQPSNQLGGLDGAGGGLMGAGGGEIGSDGTPRQDSMLLEDDAGCHVYPVAPVHEITMPLYVPIERLLSFHFTHTTSPVTYV